MEDLYFSYWGTCEYVKLRMVQNTYTVEYSTVFRMCIQIVIKLYLFSFLYGMSSTCVYIQLTYTETTL
jgi:hypothetical protein